MRSWLARLGKATASPQLNTPISSFDSQSSATTHNRQNGTSSAQSGLRTRKRLELIVYRHLQQLEARSRRRSGPRARVRDTALHTISTSTRIANTSETLESIIIDVRNLALLSRTLTTLRGRIATNSRTVKDKAQHAVVLDKQTNDKLQKDVQSYRLITVATLVDRLKINGSLARKALADLEANGQIKKVVGHSKLSIYSM